MSPAPELTDEQREGLKIHYKKFLEECEEVNRKWNEKQRLKKQPKVKKK